MIINYYKRIQISNMLSVDQLMNFEYVIKISTVNGY